MLRYLYNFFWPTRCVLCGDYLTLGSSSATSFCSQCEASLPLIARDRENSCVFCGKPLLSEMESCTECREKTFYFVRNHSLYSYTAGIKELIYQYKFQGEKRLAGFWAAKIDQYLKETALYATGEYTLVPVPGSKSGRKQRGWDQIEEILKILSKDFQYGVKDILRRKSTKAQKQLDFSRRMQNLTDKISLKRNIGSLPSKIILIDDVYTTGATLNECSRVLSQAGVREVVALTLVMD